MKKCNPFLNIGLNYNFFLSLFSECVAMDSFSDEQLSESSMPMRIELIGEMGAENKKYNFYF